MACGRSAWGGEGAAWDAACSKAWSLECGDTGISCCGGDESEAAGRFSFAHSIAFVHIQEPILDDGQAYNDDVSQFTVVAPGISPCGMKTVKTLAFSTAPLRHITAPLVSVVYRGCVAVPAFRALQALHINHENALVIRSPVPTALDGL